jgi:hypothetical protein
VNNLGWGAAALLIVSAVFVTLGRIAEQVPPLADKVIDAIRAIRRVQNEWRKR